MQKNKKYDIIYIESERNHFKLTFLPFLNMSKICIYNEEEPPSIVAVRCKTRPTFGKAKVPPKSLKAGKNVRLTNLTVTPNGRANDQN